MLFFLLYVKPHYIKKYGYEDQLFIINPTWDYCKLKAAAAPGRLQQPRSSPFQYLRLIFDSGFKRGKPAENPTIVDLRFCANAIRYLCKGMIFATHLFGIDICTRSRYHRVRYRQTTALEQKNTPT